MLQLKKFKEKIFQPHSGKYHLTEENDKSSIYNVALDEKQVTLLTQWLDQLHREHLITTTDQNDIVIMPGGKKDEAQQIFINNDDINDYMAAKIRGNKTDNDNGIINMSDIARILLKYRYVSESAGQLSFGTHTIALDDDQMTWLASIVRDARPDPEVRETLVELFDGVNTQLLRIPYEHMPPTNDAYTVAAYLFRNGHIRYDVDTRVYAYRYVEPDFLLNGKTKSTERISQHYLLSYHVRRIYVDEENKIIELEFLHDPDHRLILPARWYDQALTHRFDRNDIIDILLANGSIVDGNAFVFMDHTYFLQEPRKITSASALAPSTILRAVNLSQRQKHDLIRQYIDRIMERDGTKQDVKDRLIFLENPIDGRPLYFTPEHSQFIRQNQFQREDVIDVLAKYGQIKQDESDHWYLHYNNQYTQLPPVLIPSSIASPHVMNNLTRSTDKQISVRELVTRTPDDSEGEYIKRYHNIIDYMCRHSLVTWDRRSQIIRLHFIDQTLLIPINRLRSIVDPRVVSSSSTIDGVLPFTSRQLSEWLLNNSYTSRNTD